MGSSLEVVFLAFLPNAHGLVFVGARTWHFLTIDRLWVFRIVHLFVDAMTSSKGIEMAFGGRSSRLLVADVEFTVKSV